MRILIDMNMSPLLVEVLQSRGWEAMHWSHVGGPSARDAEILQFAKQHDCVVLTHDLDFSAILAISRDTLPSVIQVRTQDVLSEQFRDLLAAALRQFEVELKAGALIVIDESRSRARVLPLA